MTKLLEWVYSHKWVIRPEALEAIIEVLTTKKLDVKDIEIFHGKGFDEENSSISTILSQQGTRPDNTRLTAVRGSTAIINVIGVIIPRATFFSSLSGGVSLSTLANDLKIMLDDAEIESIVFNVDSPGGEITGMSEFSDMVFAAQAKKKILTFVSGIAASGGYWIGSSASEILATEVSEAGSIGVVAGYTDTKKRDEKIGIERIEIVSSQSPKKRPDASSDSGRAQIQKIVDDLADIFISHVARNRGVDIKVVAEKYGQGNMIVAKEAIELGMIDRLGSLEGLITELNKSTNNSTQIFQGGSAMDYAKFKADHPELFKKVFEDGKIEGMLEGEKTGIAGETARIKAIEAIQAPGYESIITEHKFNPEMTAEKVSALILNAQEETRKKAAKEHQDDVTKATEQGKGTKSGEGKEEVDKAAEEDCVKNMLKGAGQTA